MGLKLDWDDVGAVIGTIAGETLEGLGEQLKEKYTPQLQETQATLSETLKPIGITIGKAWASEQGKWAIIAVGIGVILFLFARRF